MCFLDSTLNRLDDDFAELEDRIKMNSLIQSWIFNTTDPELSKHISYMENAKDFWDKLKSEFFCLKYVAYSS